MENKEMCRYKRDDGCAHGFVPKECPSSRLMCFKPVDSVNNPVNYTSDGSGGVFMDFDKFMYETFCEAWERAKKAIKLRT